MNRIKVLFNFLKQVYAEFMETNILKFSASLAYYTVLSIAPLLVIILTITGFFFGREAINGQLFGQLNDMMGADAALQIQTSIQNIKLSTDNVFATTIGIVVLIVGATGIFGEIQDSLNRIWGLRLKSKQAWWRVLINRLLSFSLILSLGFVLIVSLLLNAIAATITSKIITMLPAIGALFLFVVDITVSLSLTTILFGCIFKILPDAKIKWKDVTIGAFITACLFVLGKYGIGFYLGSSSIGNIYGAAGSIMIFMIWVYYSSAILYVGAIFTKVYASNYGGKINPTNYSEWIKVEEIPQKEVFVKEV